MIIGSKIVIAESTIKILFLKNHFPSDSSLFSVAFFFKRQIRMKPSINRRFLLEVRDYYSGFFWLTQWSIQTVLYCLSRSKMFRYPLVTGPGVQVEGTLVCKNKPRVARIGASLKLRTLAEGALHLFNSFGLFKKCPYTIGSFASLRTTFLGR